MRLTPWQLFTQDLTKHKCNAAETLADTNEAAITKGAVSLTTGRRTGTNYSYWPGGFLRRQKLISPPVREGLPHKALLTLSRSEIVPTR